MIDVSLKTLIETGTIGPVSLGMSRPQVQSFLGSPEDVGGASRKHREPSIWKYGDIELHFDHSEDELWLIHLDDFVVPSGGNSIRLDPWILTNALTLELAEKKLKDDGIRVAASQCAGGECLSVGVGINLTFNDDDGHLCVISYSGGLVH